MKNTKQMREDMIMDYDSEFEINMLEIEEPKSVSIEAEPQIQAKYVVLRAYNVEGKATDIERDSSMFMDLDTALKGAAKKAVKGRDDVYVLQVLTKVEQVNYEALVKATPITDASNLIEG